MQSITTPGELGASLASGGFSSFLLLREDPDAPRRKPIESRNKHGDSMIRSRERPRKSSGAKQRSKRFRELGE